MAQEGSGYNGGQGTLGLSWDSNPIGLDLPPAASPAL